ncbi:hypothetical protein MKL09_04180 [Methylobacterium sp. J-048]|uniref:hypothetical protein n=1 Tax=Methylobacterium sp. J-048 TaxID=2836635 RepID=UPI001FB8F26B|nr:hypothetical protein [Methylobacterium sp. J-048]MCJ2055749.1 hypothetical protein [Methylobacterium sp. J-048]
MTRTITILGLSALLPMLAATAAAAQSQTGTGGGPTSTVTAPHTSPVGRTMPPVSGAGEATPNDRRNRTREQIQDDKISQGICIGCSPK